VLTEPGDDLHRSSAEACRPTVAADDIGTGSVGMSPGPPGPGVDWDARFDRPDYIFGTRPNTFLEANVDVIPEGGRVLCIADGEGRNSVWLAERGYSVEAVDASTVALAKAERLAETRGVHVDVRHGDLTRMDWPPARYDAVVGVFLQFVPSRDRPALWASIHGTLREGAVFLLIGYTPEQLRYGTGGPGDVDRLYDPDVLRRELALFTLDRFVAREYEMDEGPAHRGMSAVIEVIARR